MTAWTSLTDTSVVKTYREVPALKNNAFREFARFCNLLSRNKFTGLQYFKPRVRKSRDVRGAAIPPLAPILREGWVALHSNGFRVDPKSWKLLCCNGSRCSSSHDTNMLRVRN